MVPRNDKELQTISDIVQSFRWASKPGLTGLFEMIILKAIKFYLSECFSNTVFNC